MDTTETVAQRFGPEDLSVSIGEPQIVLSFWEASQSGAREQLKPLHPRRPRLDAGISAGPRQQGQAQQMLQNPFYNEDSSSYPVPPWEPT